MENMYVGLFLLAGATIALLGMLLLSSERQLKKKRRELDALARAHGSPTPAGNVQDLETQSSAREQELLDQISLLSNQLEESQTTIAELQAGQLQWASADSGKQQEQTIISLRAQLDTSERQLRESAAQARENAERNVQLQDDLAQLARQQQANQERIAELQAEQERILQDAQSEKQHLCAETQQLQQEIAELRSQLQAGEALLGTKSDQCADLMERHGQLQADMATLNQQLDQMTLKNNALAEEKDALVSKLGDAQKALEELRMLHEAAQSDNQHWQTVNQDLQRELAKLKLDFQSMQSQLDEAERRALDSADRHSRLEREAGELKEQLQASQIIIAQFHADKERWSAIDSENQTLRHECADLGERLESSAHQLSDLSRLNQESADQTARLKAEAAELARRLEETQWQVRELGRLQQELASVESREMTLKHRQEEQETEIALLQRQLSDAQGKVQELAAARNRLAEAERQYQELRDEHQRLQEEISRQPVAPSVLNPLPSLPDTTTAQANALTAGPGEAVEGRMPAYPGDDGFGPATAIKQMPQRKRSRAAAIAAGVILAVGGAAAILGTRYFASTDAPVTREFMPDERSAPGESVSQAAEPTSGLRAPGKYKIVRATAVYSGPTEKSALITRIEPGIKINVVDARDGWLEIRSKYGRPPGFVREETAEKIDQN